MIRYRVTLTPDTNGTLLVRAPDFPEVITCGDNTETALGMAVDAFREAIAGKIMNKQPIPKPSRIRANEPHVVLPLQTEMKVRLYESMMESGVRKSDLARKMKLHRQEIERLLDFNQSTNLAKIESAFAALGKRINLEVADVE